MLVAAEVCWVLSFLVLNFLLPYGLSGILEGIWGSCKAFGEVLLCPYKMRCRGVLASKLVSGSVGIPSICSRAWEFSGLQQEGLGRLGFHVRST